MDEFLYESLLRVHGTTLHLCLGSTDGQMFQSANSSWGDTGVRVLPSLVGPDVNDDLTLGLRERPGKRETGLTFMEPKQIFYVFRRLHWSIHK